VAAVPFKAELSRYAEIYNDINKKAQKLNERRLTSEQD
jgi:hypothetical protein